MKVVAIALNTFWEAVRDRILYAILIFALLMLAGSTILVTLSVGGEAKIIKDLGLSAMSLFGILILLIVGVNLIYREMEGKTIYTLLTKPISRTEYLLGKYGGILLLLIVNALAMAIITEALIVLIQGRPFFPLFYGVFFILLEQFLLSAFILLFLVFTTPFLSIFLTLCLFIVGHTTTEVKIIMEKSKNWVARSLFDLFYYIFPNLDIFEIKRQIVHNILPSSNTILLSSLYGLAYIIFILIVSTEVFKRREL